MKATLAQAAKILGIFKETPAEQVQAVIGSGLLADLRDADIIQINREEFRRVCGLKKGKADQEVVATGNTFKLTVDCSQSLKQMIQAGKYDWVNDDITAKHFPPPAGGQGGKGKVEAVFELAHFNKYISSEDAIAELKKQGFRPAKIEELLAFGEKYPEEQRKYPIVALGSVWQDWSGYRRVASLWCAGSSRGLGLLWFERGWDGGYRFLVVRES